MMPARIAYNGALRDSNPARWSLCTWLRKHARGGGWPCLRRKKSTCTHKAGQKHGLSEGDIGGYLEYPGIRI